MKKASPLICICIFVISFLLFFFTQKLSDKAYELGNAAVVVCNEYATLEVSADDAADKLGQISVQLHDLYDIESLDESSRYSRKTFDLITAVDDVRSDIKMSSFGESDSGFDKDKDKLVSLVGKRASTQNVPMPTAPVSSLSPGKKQEVVKLGNEAAGYENEYALNISAANPSIDAAKDIIEKVKNISSRLYSLKNKNKDQYTIDMFNSVIRLCSAMQVNEYDLEKGYDDDYSTSSVEDARDRLSDLLDQ